MDQDNQQNWTQWHIPLRYQYGDLTGKTDKWSDEKVKGHLGLKSSANQYTIRLYVSFVYNSNEVLLVNPD